MTARRILAVAAALTVALSLGACSSYNDDRGVGDAPSEQVDDQPVLIWPNADQFPNIAVMCVGGNGVYTTTREAPPAVVPNDPECAEGGVVAEGDQ